MTTYLDRLKALGCQPADYNGMYDRADYLVKHPEPYSQSKRSLQTVKRRCDCSGCACEIAGSYMDGPGSWGGHSTTTLATYGVIYQIDKSQAGKGDFYGDCGPSSAETANGHIGWIQSINNADGTILGVDHGSGTGPRRINRTWGTFEAWRYAFASNATPPQLGVDGLVLRLDSYGGPSMDVQRAINVWSPKSLTEDGVLGPISIGTVTEFQRAHRLEPDGIIGPATSAKLLTYLTPTVPVPPLPVPGPVPLFTSAQELRIAELARQSIKLAL